MNKRSNILKFFIVSVVCLLFVIGIIYLFVWGNASKLQGKLVFAQTFNKGILIDKIEIQTNEETVVLNQKDSFWSVENNNNYYADFSLMNVLLTSLNKSIYSIKFPYNQEIAYEKYLNNPDKFEQNSGMLIKTYVKGEKIDEILIGLSDESKKYYFSRNMKDDNIWLISENFNLPIYSKDWLIRPVLVVPAKQIELIEIDGKKVRRYDEYTSFYNEKDEVVNVSVLTDTLSRLFIDNAQKKDDFEKNMLPGMKVKNIKITTFFGLVFDINLYYQDNNKIWCSIKLSTTSLPLSVVNDYINDNKFLYDDWFFEISSDQGHILRDFRLM